MRAFVAGVVACVVLMIGGIFALNYFPESTEEQSAMRSTKVHLMER